MKFAQPIWLMLLVLPPLLAATAIVMTRIRRSQWSEFTAPRLRAALLKTSQPMPRWFSLFFLLAACTMILLALARPQGASGTRTEKSVGRNLLIALDLSRSMRVQDVKPDRLAQAKIVMLELLEAMPNERIGIIGFAGNAHLYAPLTVDHSAVRETVEQIDETWVPWGGSDLAAAVRLGVETLRKTGQKNNALVILSDGEHHDGELEQMISKARDAGVIIIAIGVGTVNGDYVPNRDFPDQRMYDRSGRPVISRLQPDVMRKLATETKGRYAVAGSGTDVTAVVRDVVKDLDAFEMTGRERIVTVEFYQWLVLPAIVFLFASILTGTRWRGVRTALWIAAGLTLLPTPNVRADQVGDAKRALEDGRFSEAYEAYKQLAESSRIASRKARFHLGEATAAYRLGDFHSARSAYSNSLLSDNPQVLSNSHAGMGNTLFQLGWHSLANEPYPDDATKAPSLARFDELVRERLKKLKSPASTEGNATGNDESIDSLIMNWTDAVRHFDSALGVNPANPKPARNRETVMTYLKRLQELLREDKQQTENSLPPPEPEKGEPQPGDPQQDEDNEGDAGDNTKPPEQPGERGDQPREPREDKGDKGEKPDDNAANPDEDGDPDKERKPDETPKEHARRKLKENADLEKGPLTPGRLQLRDPEKDW